jgi:hypothetical protein
MGRDTVEINNRREILYVEVKVFSVGDGDPQNKFGLRA